MIAADDSAPPLDAMATASATEACWTIEWRSSAADLPADLWAACFPPPLEGLWWYDTRVRSGLEAQFRFEYGLLQRDGRAVGIVPIFFMDVPMDLGGELVPLTHYCRHRNSLLHRIFAWVARRIDWASLDHDLKTFLAAHPEDNRDAGV